MTRDDMQIGIGLALRRLRKSHAISQAALACLLNQRPKTIRQIERGQKPLSPAELWLLAQHLQFSITTFIGDAMRKGPTRQN
ncbi:MAG: helix-turn-helix transcriptional regulator [Deltaproteobacteria bacterium]|nr:helix-turn-helix transcriptional regulator [Deltaproteobacteria bacterium]